MKDHLTPSDLAGAVKDILGKPATVGGKTYDHLTEVNNALSGLKSSARELTEILKNGNLTDAQRSAAQAVLSQTAAQIDRVEKILATAAEIAKTVIP